MKKLISLFLALSLCAALSGCGAVEKDVAGSSASSVSLTDAVSEADAISSADVMVTIVDAGDIVLPHDNITVYDTDDDGALTISDALFCAHELYCPDGADGYGAEKSEYGISLTKLWGTDNGGCYGYYINNASSSSLGDAITAGDSIVAYSFSDLTGWSDSYAWFEAEELKGSELTLTLFAIAFDENWNAVSVPVEGASILINGKGTACVTDADGKAVIALNGAGEYAITAYSESMTLVTPLYEISVD